MIEKKGEGPVPLLIGFFSGPQRIDVGEVAEAVPPKAETPAADQLAAR